MYMYYSWRDRFTASHGLCTMKYDAQNMRGNDVFCVAAVISPKTTNFVLLAERLALLRPWNDQG